MSIHEMPPNFDNALKEAFRRQEPPDGFADRVMARIPQKRSSGGWRRQWLAIAASACFGMVGIGAWQQHQRQVEGEKARQQLMYALTVASESLQTTKHIITR
jgi:uncharacterized protein HemX